MSKLHAGTVLVVDDTEATRYVLARLLTAKGYRVLEAATGAAALATLSEGPDIIILDVNLPDIKGTELVTRIKADPQTSSIMLLTMSARFTRTQDRVEALECGADGSLIQPVDPHEFLATVRSLMRIRRAEEAVRKSNQDLASFAYTASHDMQEPLRMISNYLGLLERRAAEKLSPREIEYIHFAVDGACRMSVMIRDLLSLATCEQSRMVRELVSSESLCSEAISNLALKITEAGAVVRVGSLPKIGGDRALLSQVFQNLISNGIKFRGSQPPLIDISAEADDFQHIFRITDNGMGIPADSQERIFGLFQRLHPVHQYPGSGIGLALCKRIVERHGGAIGVKSQVGVGSTFWFSIPK
jgi:two-component system sensor histidine kinase/response regulator